MVSFERAEEGTHQLYHFGTIVFHWHLTVLDGDRTWWQTHIR